MSDIKNFDFKIPILLIVFSIAAFLIRILPLFFLPDEGAFHIIRADSEYNLRQIEVMVNNFPQYNWFDPMTAYPSGKNIGWGPLFPMIAGAFAIIAGASQQSDIIYLAGFVTPLMAAAMVPVVYLIAKEFSQNKYTAITAAAIIPFISLFFINYTSFGYVDHHAGEILFSSIFILFYILALTAIPAEKITDVRDRRFLNAVVYSVFAGIAYCACYFTAPTTAIFLVIISVFTLFSCIISHSSGIIPVKEGIINSVSLSIPVIVIFLFGIKYGGFSYYTYSAIHLAIPLLVIIATWYLVILSAILNRESNRDTRLIYPVLIIISAIIGSFAVKMVLPDIFNTVFSGIGFIFGFSEVAIAEMQPWTLDYAIQSYHFAFILAFIGFIIAARNLYQKKQQNYLFLLTWTLITLYATIRHLRFEYFIAAPFSILSAIAITYVYENYYQSFSEYIRNFSTPGEESGNKGRKKKSGSKQDKKSSAGAFIFIFTGIITVLFFANSIVSDISFAEDYAATSFEKNKWIEAMVWMNENTPDSGVDYYGEYSRDSFVYPPDSYGVMCWWDFGHIITLIGKRIPVSNPFQDNVKGDYGSANFLISDTEAGANTIMENSGAKYVVVNSELTETKGFSGILSWLESDYDIFDYLMDIPHPSGEISTLYNEDYYNSMAVRLMNLDGSLTEASGVVVLTLKTNPATGQKGIINYQETDYQSAVLQGESSENMILSDDPDTPDCIVPALKNYRLIYESPEQDDSIKIYEYVKGYEISGEGTVELEIITNSGREFTYRQKSENGKFILPYSTLDNPYDVKAKSKYHIPETGEYFDVTEESLSGN